MSKIVRCGMNALVVAMLAACGDANEGVSTPAPNDAAKPRPVAKEITPVATPVTLKGVPVAEIKRRGLPFWTVDRSLEYPGCPTLIHGPVKSCLSSGHRLYFDRSGKLIQHHVLGSDGSPISVISFKYYHAGYTEFLGEIADGQRMSECQELSAEQHEYGVKCLASTGARQWVYTAELGGLLEENDSTPYLLTLDNTGRLVEILKAFYKKDEQGKTLVSKDIDTADYLPNHVVKVAIKRSYRQESITFTADAIDRHNNVTAWRVNDEGYALYKVQYTYW